MGGPSVRKRRLRRKKRKLKERKKKKKKRRKGTRKMNEVLKISLQEYKNLLEFKAGSE